MPIEALSKCVKVHQCRVGVLSDLSKHTSGWMEQNKKKVTHEGVIARKLADIERWHLARTEGRKNTNLGIPSRERRNCLRFLELSDAGPPSQEFSPCGSAHIVYNTPETERGPKLKLVARKDIKLASHCRSHL